MSSARAVQLTCPLCSAPVLNDVGICLQCGSRPAEEGDDLRAEASAAAAVRPRSSAGWSLAVIGTVLTGLVFQLGWVLPAGLLHAPGQRLFMCVAVTTVAVALFTMLDCDRRLKRGTPTALGLPPACWFLLCLFAWPIAVPLYSWHGFFLSFARTCRMVTVVVCVAFVVVAAALHLRVQRLEKERARGERASLLMQLRHESVPRPPQ